MEENKLIKKHFKILNEFLDMEGLPIEFHLGCALLVEKLNKDLAMAILVKDKEYMQMIKERSNILKLTDELTEAMEYHKEMAQKYRNKKL